MLTTIEAIGCSEFGMGSDKPKQVVSMDAGTLIAQKGGFVIAPAGGGSSFEREMTRLRSSYPAQSAGPAHMTGPGGFRPGLPSLGPQAGMSMGPIGKTGIEAMRMLPSLGRQAGMQMDIGRAAPKKSMLSPKNYGTSSPSVTSQYSSELPTIQSPYQDYYGENADVSGFGLGAAQEGGFSRIAKYALFAGLAWLVYRELGRGRGQARNPVGPVGQLRMLLRDLLEARDTHNDKFYEEVIRELRREFFNEKAAREHARTLSAEKLAEMHSLVEGKRRLNEVLLYAGLKGDVERWLGFIGFEIERKAGHDRDWRRKFGFHPRGWHDWDD